MRSFVLLFALLASSFANDISVSTSFGHAAERNANNQQWINVHNLASASSTDPLSNAVSNIQFKVAGVSLEGGLFVASYPSGARSGAVGTVLSGASGSGSFAVVAQQAGQYEVAVEVSYTLNGANKIAVFGPFALTVSSGSKKDVVVDVEEQQIVSLEQARADGLEVRLDARQPGNTDISIVPSAYAAEADSSTWNNFNIKVGSNSITTVAWNLYNGEGVAIGYYNNVNTVSSITHNTTYETYVAFTSSAGIYVINNTVSYKIGTTNKMFWIATNLAVGSPGTSVGRSALALKNNDAQAAGQFVRVEYALGAAIAGVALVAAIAVVASMLIIRKKNTSITV